MAFTCGKCKQTHQRADEARVCYGLLSTAPATAQETRSATAPVDNTIEIGAVIKPGIYTVVRDNGDRRTFRVRSAEWAKDLPAGSLVLEFLSGPENTSDYTGFGFIVKGKLRMWNKFRSSTSPLSEFAQFLLGASPEQLDGFGEAYALESGRCYRCNRLLTTPQSIQRGLGPHCASVAS